MSFIDSIAKALNVGEMLPTGYRIEILGEKGVYIEGVKFLKGYSPEKVEIILKKGSLVVKGENLTISKYCCGDIALIGKVKTVERV
ncbi:MAG TPA: hypothetical protein DDY82_01650 [Clostridiales bacterium]|nr:hypothetical protein [Clostridiales bacterium]HBJ97760.1 hypothetical protein [Clostridiales bacterium]